MRIPLLITVFALAACGDSGIGGGALGGYDPRERRAEIMESVQAACFKGRNDQNRWSVDQVRHEQLLSLKADRDFELDPGDRTREAQIRASQNFLTMLDFAEQVAISHSAERAKRLEGLRADRVKACGIIRRHTEECVTATHNYERLNQCL